MKTSRLMGTAALLAITAFGAQSAFAWQAGDIYVRGGYEKSDSSSSNAADYGEKMGVNDDGGFAYGLGYLFHDNIGVELNGSQTTKHELGNLGGFERTPINLMVNYYPLGGHTARVNPYVGAGVNYTTFDVANGFDASIDDSWGLAAQAGIDMSVTENVLVGAWARYADVDADMKIDGNNAGDLDLDPVSVGAGVTYRF